MREKLFRGKRIDNGEWVYGYYVFRRKRRGIFGQTITELDFDTHYIVSVRGESFEVDPSTVGQYTGLPDLHNNPIFEGDIVKGVCYAGKTEGIVTFKDGYYYIHAYAGYCERLSRCSHMVEVIGNIHDNPELLEDKP